MTYKNEFDCSANRSDEYRENDVQNKTMNPKDRFEIWMIGACCCNWFFDEMPKEIKPESIRKKRFSLTDHSLVAGKWKTMAIMKSFENIKTKY